MRKNSEKTKLGTDALRIEHRASLPPRAAGQKRTKQNQLQAWLLLFFVVPPTRMVAQRARVIREIPGGASVDEMNEKLS